MLRKNIRSDKAFGARNAHSAGVVASGRFLFTSGITPRDEAGNLVGTGDMRAQIRQTLNNLEEVLNTAGVNFSSVVKYTVFVTDLDAYISARKNPETGHEIAMGAAPALTVVEISRLADPDMMIEIEAIAQIPKA